MRHTVLLLLAIALVFAGTACGGDEEVVPDEPGVEEPLPDEEPAETFEIVMTSFALEPSTVRIEEAGTYAFQAVNEGDHPHALAIAGPGVEETTETVGPGETAELVVTLEVGDYEIWCPVPGHRGQNMEGTVLVGGEADTDDADDAEDADDADDDAEETEEPYGGGY